MGLDLESLRCFEVASRELHFTRAARKVGLSLSAFSERISRLEDELSTSLFDRTTRQVVLTAAGQRLLPQARRCLEEVQSCHHVIHQNHVPDRLSLVIGTRFELGLSWLLPALTTLESRLSGCSFHLSFGDTPQLVEGLLSGQVDAVITSARMGHPRITTQPLHEEHYILVASASYPLRRPNSWDSEPLLLDIDASLPLFRYFSDHHPDRVPNFVESQYLGTIAAVRLRLLEGRGVAVLPTYFVQEDLRLNRLTQLLPDCRLGSDWFRLLWRTGHPNTEVLHLLTSELRTFPLA